MPRSAAAKACRGREERGSEAGHEAGQGRHAAQHILSAQHHEPRVLIGHMPTRAMVPGPLTRVRPPTPPTTSVVTWAWQAGSARVASTSASFKSRSCSTVVLCPGRPWKAQMPRQSGGGVSRPGAFAGSARAVSSRRSTGWDSPPDAPGVEGSASARPATTASHLRQGEGRGGFRSGPVPGPPQRRRRSTHTSPSGRPRAQCPTPAHQSCGNSYASVWSTKARGSALGSYPRRTQAPFHGPAGGGGPPLASALSENQLPASRARQPSPQLADVGGAGHTPAIVSRTRTPHRF